MKRKLTVALLLAALAIIISLVYKPIGLLPEEGKGTDVPTVELAGETIRVSIADTPDEREQGLSGRAALASDEGMLFVFPEDGKYVFWMKDMLFAIDIIWISHSGEIVDIRTSVLPDSYPATFAPRQEARYVLELPQGWVEGHAVEVGDIVRL